MSPNAVDPRKTAPFRIYFWSNENLDTHKSPHVHVESSTGWAEFWLDPVRVKVQGSYNDRELARARKTVERFEAESLAAWRRFHGGN